VPVSYNNEIILQDIIHNKYIVLTVPLTQFYSSSSCSWRIRCFSCSLILKMKLVPPSLPWSSYVFSSCWFIL